MVKTGNGQCKRISLLCLIDTKNTNQNDANYNNNSNYYYYYCKNKIISHLKSTYIHTICFKMDENEILKFHSKLEILFSINNILKRITGRTFCEEIRLV